jgi:hypothetical protein
MKIDLELIEQRLFSDPSVRRKILRDYGFKVQPQDAVAMASELITQLEQSPVDDPLKQNPSNADVFRAAVKALSSNSRAWATFLKAECKLSDLLREYDSARAHNAFESDDLSINDIKACLPGQSSSADANAIRRWARRLTEVEDYYAYIRGLGSYFRHQAKERFGTSLPNSELLLCVAGYLGDPPVAHPEISQLDAAYLPDPTYRKLPGMRYVLVSEFLRNLRWEGFKPDRHIQRLFDRWYPQGVAQVKPDVDRLQRLIGRKTKDLRTYLTYSLIGISLSPLGATLSEVDNLVWLLGAYVEKKGKESDRSYLVMTDSS